MNRTAEAVPLLEKIPQEFEKSEYIEKATKRLEEIKTAAANPPAPSKPPKQAPAKQEPPKQEAPKPAPQQNQAPPKS